MVTTTAQQENRATASSKVVGVSPPDALLARPRLFDALAAAFAVQFQPLGTLEQGAALDGVLHFGRPEDQPGPSPTPTLVFHDPAATPYATRVHFTDSPELDSRLRRRRIWERRTPAADLADSPLRGQVLASCEGRPVWVTEAAGQARLDQVALAPPELGESEVLLDLLRPGRFLSLVPLVQFLRDVAGGALWEPPPLRATLLIDDPSLQWPSYGYVRFPDALERARAHRYHLSIAMVPLDAWPVHPGVARLFREHSDLLSIVMHGNDHVRRELARGEAVEDGRRLFAQAVRRIQAFEKRSGVSVGRVVVPPHGVCSEESTERMLELDLEALCISRPHPWLSAPRPDRPLAGWHPAEMAGRGLPVIPRMHVRGGSEEVLLRAFLGQPLVLYGHHDDVGPRLEGLAAAAELVNSLGPVDWQPLARIATSNFATRREGSGLGVRLFSRRARVEVPEGVDAIRFELPELDAEPDEVRLLCGGASGGMSAHSQGWWTSDVFPVPSPGTVEVSMHTAPSIDPAAIPPPPGRSWPALRRAGGQIRDRTAPLLRRQGVSR
jgi:hypothetical protein